MEIDELNGEMADLEQELDDTQAALEDAEETEANQYDTMKKRIQYIYENGETNLMEVLLSADSIADLLNQVEYVEQITNYDNTLLENYTETKEQIAQMKADLEDTLEQKNLVSEELAANQDALETLMSNKQTELAKYEKSIDESENLSSEYDAQIADQEAKVEELLELERKRVIEEERKKKEEEEAKKKAEEEAAKQEAANNSSSSNSSNSGSSGSSSSGSSSGSSSSNTTVSTSGFMWPCPSSSRITCGFGYRTQPTSGASTYHQGIDIGAVVSQNVNTGVITVVKPYVTGPAYEAGMLPGDIIYKVNGEEVTGVDLSEVVSNMKGEADTDVQITVLRDGEEDPIDLTITRRTIEIPTVEYKMLEGNIGYILVSEFDEITSSQYRDALDDLESQGMVALVVDLRGNPGGRLTTVCDMLDRMLPEGLLVYQEDKYGNRDEETSTDEESFDLPLAVLINGNSASASEIFAGAIQDYGTGTIIGTTSYGKGIVQSIIPLQDGSAVKVTVSKYYTPNGRNIHGIGITPDVEVELDEDVANQVVIEYEDDNQLQKAVEVLNEQLAN